MPDNYPKADSQTEMYKLIKSDYRVTTRLQYDADKDHLKMAGQWPEGFGWDYLILDTLEGIDYLLPNDEDWFDIVAVDHANELATFTGFCEMDDFEHADSDYRYVLDPADNTLKCRFEVKS